MLCRCTAVVPPVAVCSHCRRSQTLSPVTPQQLSLEGPPRTALDERAGYRLVNAHEGFKSRAGAYTLLNLHSLFLVVRRAATADPASYIPIPLCQSNCWPPLTQHYGVADRATRNKPQRAIGQTKKKHTRCKFWYCCMPASGSTPSHSTLAFRLARAALERLSFVASVLTRSGQRLAPLRYASAVHTVLDAWCCWGI